MQSRGGVPGCRGPWEVGHGARAFMRWRDVLTTWLSLECSSSSVSSKTYGEAAESLVSRVGSTAS